MDKLEYIKSGIEKLYKTNKNIHISVKLIHPRVIIERAPAVITGVYRNIFQIEENDGGHPALHTFRYSDVLIGHVLIAEPDYTPAVNTLNKK